jgi:hypothetical protein
LVFLYKNFNITFLHLLSDLWSVLGTDKNVWKFLGGKLKRFNNIYINNFGDEMSEDEMKGMFEPLGKLISVKVKF